MLRSLSQICRYKLCHNLTHTSTISLSRSSISFSNKILSPLIFSNNNATAVGMNVLSNNKLASMEVNILPGFSPGFSPSFKYDSLIKFPSVNIGNTTNINYYTESVKESYLQVMSKIIIVAKVCSCVIDKFLHMRAASGLNQQFIDTAKNVSAALNDDQILIKQKQEKIMLTFNEMIDKIYAFVPSKAVVHVPVFKVTQLQKYGLNENLDLKLRSSAARAAMQYIGSGDIVMAKEGKIFLTEKNVYSAAENELMLYTIKDIKYEQENDMIKTIVMTVHPEQCETITHVFAFEDFVCAEYLVSFIDKVEFKKCNKIYKGNPVFITEFNEQNIYLSYDDNNVPCVGDDINNMKLAPDIELRLADEDVDRLQKFSERLSFGQPTSYCTSLNVLNNGINNTKQKIEEYEGSNDIQKWWNGSKQMQFMRDCEQRMMKDIQLYQLSRASLVDYVKDNVDEIRHKSVVTQVGTVNDTINDGNARLERKLDQILDKI